MSKKPGDYMHLLENEYAHENEVYDENKDSDDEQEKKKNLEKAGDYNNNNNKRCRD